MILDNAIRESRITLAHRDHGKGELEKDLAAAEAQLANQQPALNTTSSRANSATKKPPTTPRPPAAPLFGCLAEKQAGGMSYDDAWTLAKKERSTLFEQMTRK
jgi:hypothetical protein